MDKKEYLLMRINKAVLKCESENYVTPHCILSGLKGLENFTIRGVPVIYDENKKEDEFEVIE